MAQSPLELYQQAYNLHHKENSISEACDIYDGLIRDYPGTEIAGYASVQLYSIQADKTTRKLSIRRSGNNPLVIALLVVGFILFSAAIVWMVHETGRVRRAYAQQNKITEALSKMYSGEDDEALIILSELKIMARGALTPFQISADVFLRSNNFLKARQEYEAYQRLHPGDAIATTEIAKINRQEDRFIQAKLEKEKVGRTIPEEVVKTVDKSSRPAPSSAPRRRSKPSSREFIDPSDISYF